MKNDKKFNEKHKNTKDSNFIQDIPQQTLVLMKMSSSRLQNVLVKAIIFD